MEKVVAINHLYDFVIILSHWLLLTQVFFVHLHISIIYKRLHANTTYFLYEFIDELFVLETYRPRLQLEQLLDELDVYLLVQPSLHVHIVIILYFDLLVGCVYHLHHIVEHLALLRVQIFQLFFGAHWLLVVRDGSFRADESLWWHNRIRHLSVDLPNLDFLLRGNFFFRWRVDYHLLFDYLLRIMNLIISFISMHIFLFTLIYKILFFFIYCLVISREKCLLGQLQLVNRRTLIQGKTSYIS